MVLNLCHIDILRQCSSFFPCWNKFRPDSPKIGASCHIAGITLSNSYITYAVHFLCASQRAAMGLKQGWFWPFKIILGTCSIHYQHMTLLAFYYWYEEYGDLLHLYTLSFYLIVKYNSLFLSPSALHNFGWMSNRNHGLELAEINLCFVLLQFPVRCINCFANCIKCTKKRKM